MIFSFNAAQHFDQEGKLIDEPTPQFIRKLLITLVQLEKSTRWARAGIEDPWSNIIC